MAKVHAYRSQEPMLHVNAFIAETSKGVVLIDTTLTMSDSRNLKKMIDEINKPLLAVLLTHGHPDHIAGTYNIVPNGDVPIISLQSVYDLMKATEEIKHQQWSSMFGKEWIPKWIYPNQIIDDNDVVTFEDLQFRVIDLGAGGDSDANSIWLLENEKAAFLGDFIFNNNHAYMADGNLLRWIGNLERFKPLLKEYNSYYIGHGDACDFNMIEKQKIYFLDYISTLLDITKGASVLNEEIKKKFESIILEKYSGYGCEFMITLSADRVFQEVKGVDIHESVVKE